MSHDTKRLAKLESKISTEMDSTTEKSVEVKLVNSENFESRLGVLMVSTAVPAMIGTFLVLETIPNINDVTGISVGFSVVMTLLGFDTRFWPSRVIRHQFKNTTGESISLASARTIRKAQKALTDSKPFAIIPAHELLGDSPMMKLAEEKGMKLGIVVRADSVGLHLMVPDSQDVMWDNAISNIADIYSLSTSDRKMVEA